jgi:hypothetical protein
MNKSTLIILFAAVVLGVTVYYLEIKPGRTRDDNESETKTKSAFDFKREDVAGIDINRAGQTVKLDNKDGKWTITQPVDTAADQSTANSIVDSMTGAKAERNLTATPDEIKSFGLAEPAVSVDIRLKDGKAHHVRLGTKDFSGTSVYAQVDDAKDVTLLPASLLSSADKSLTDLRDRSVFDARSYEINSFSLKNENAAFELKKENSNWSMTQPVQARAEDSSVTSMLSSLDTMKGSDIAAENSNELGKYGLDKPKITLSAHLEGGAEKQLLVSGKVGEKYYAKNSDHPQVFEVTDTLVNKLNVKVSDLRDKQLITLNRDDVKKIEIKNPNLTLVAEKGDDGKWTVQEPADSNGKEADFSKIWDKLDAKASSIVDSPSAAVKSKLAQPAVDVKLTGKDGKTHEVKITGEVDKDVYATVDDNNSAVFKLDKKTLDDLSFKAADVVL